VNKRLPVHTRAAGGPLSAEWMLRAESVSSIQNSV